MTKRQRLQEGDRVEALGFMAFGGEDTTDKGNGWFGTVTRVMERNVKVRWDKTGSEGRHTASTLRKV